MYVYFFVYMQSFMCVCVKHVFLSLSDAKACLKSHKQHVAYLFQSSDLAEFQCFDVMLIRVIHAMHVSVL